ncbi:NUDIX domain-containing protein [Candidatus Woesearchaeota archaeon]|nr:NUDIX domain-containing protein [Candidatus Woesearchaeota archaeon]
MLFEKSAGAVVFRKNKEIKFLMLYRHAHKHYRETWDFPKGNIEPGETIKKTAVREIEEETGISKIELVENFMEKIHYHYKRDGEFISKDVIFFLAKTTRQKVKVSEEHDGFGWFTFNESMKKLTFPNSKKILEKAYGFLKNNKLIFQKSLAQF